ncbi:MAG: pyridoxine 4-dehydrogenase [Miltoncostaeaceae bacterium]|jgi:aryl-alcohol dehydrogenase-like predicted oxidoreductase|nr:pyridoxine 4-dehydrogenase [Miltoncostaeaceae bacterium]
MRSTFEIGGRPIGRMGFGAMQLPGPGVFGPPRDRGEAIAILRRAVALGVDHIDTAQYYGPDVANELIREALRPYPDGLRIATKVGGARGTDGSWFAALRPEELRAGVEDNLRSLGLDRLFLVNLRLVHRHRPDVPLEEMVGELAGLRTRGLVELIGLSNVGLDELRAAEEVTPIACVQNNFGLLNRESRPVLDACREAGLAFVPFFPLGSAFPRDPEGGSELGGPARLGREGAVARVAEKHGATVPQVALAWLLQVAPNVLVIPGTSSMPHLEENVAAADLRLDEGDIAALDALA